MEITLSAFKADVGGICHIRPTEEVTDSIRQHVVAENGKLIIHSFVDRTGDDNTILMAHTHGVKDENVHRLAFEAMMRGTEVAQSHGLYKAGQDLIKRDFTGQTTGTGIASAEMEFEEREGESFALFQGDKTDPGAYNLPLYLAFADPMNTAGFLLSPAMKKGFRFTVQDVNHTENDKVIVLDAPERLYDLAILLRDTERFVVKSIHARSNDDVAVTVSTERLTRIAGKYTGKDDPIALVRLQSAFPAAGEMLAPFVINQFVAGFMRGSHIGPLMPATRRTIVSYFDGPPLVTCMVFCMKDGILTEPADGFAHPIWDYVREQCSVKSIELRRQGFFGPAMLPMSELEYTEIKDLLGALEQEFKVLS